MRRRVQARDRQEKGEGERSILKKLHAALLRDRSGCSTVKMVCVKGVSWVTGTLGRAKSHFTKSKRGWGPHHDVEAAVDWCSSILFA